MKIDLHNHSEFSYDGKITYEEILNYRGDLDIIAITDHNNFEFHNKYMNVKGETYKIGKLTIIPGEEIMTSDSGEIIGLFLKEHINDQLPMVETIMKIKKQGGLVYVPHPFDLYRSKSRPKMRVIRKMIDNIDIIETNNGKYFFFESIIANSFSIKYNKLRAYGSDAHEISNLGRTFLDVKLHNRMLTKCDLITALSSDEIRYYKHKKRIIYRIIRKLMRIINR